MSLERSNLELQISHLERYLTQIPRDRSADTFRDSGERQTFDNVTKQLNDLKLQLNKTINNENQIKPEMINPMNPAEQERQVSLLTLGLIIGGILLVT